MFLAPSKSKSRTNIENMGLPKTSDHIQIKIPNYSQESQVSLNDPNQDFKDMDVLCTFKIKIESQNLDHGCVKAQ